MGDRILIENQASNENLLEWLRERLRPDCEQYERGNAVPEELKEINLGLPDLLYALRNATSVCGRYDGGCFIVQGPTVDGILISVVVAPPSQKNRVRIVKVWRE